MKLPTGLLAAAVAAGAGCVAWNRLRRRAGIDLRGKVVLITGGSRGLGLQMAREFGSQGARVAICARDAAELARAQSDLTARGVRCHTAVCDIASQRQAIAMVDEVARELGPIDVLVNNAGLIQVGPFSEMTTEDFRRAMDVIFWGALYTTFAVLPSMRERGQGNIVNITSIGAKISVPHLLPYSCAKFAVLAFSEGLRSELAPAGIRVTTVVPGLMRTGSHLKAEFKGRHALEYAWFSAGAATPFVSIDAERAARAIVRATASGDNEKILSVPADILARVHGVWPELSGAVLSLVNLFMPSGVTGNSDIRTGHEVQSRMNSRVWEALLAPGQKAAQALNQL